MANLRFLLLALLFAGVAQIQSAEPEAENEDLFKDMPAIGPSVDMKFLPGLFLPEEPIRSSGFKGQLLTPKDGCGLTKESAGRIVGGTPAKRGQYPWMALLGYLQHGSQISFNCGGSLITSRHVLSAAHCINRMLYMVRLGEHDYGSYSKDPEVEDVRVSRTSPHTGFNQRLMINDIAIVHLQRDVHFTDRIRPVCLPIDDQTRRQNFARSNPFVAGWGTTREDGRPSSLLLHVQVPVITNNECRERYRSIGMVQSESQFNDNYVICAGHTFGGKDSCQGDSGGPLMLPVHQGGKFPFFQIGVVSYGIGCARPHIPGVYANVQSYVDWIKQNTRY